MLSVAGVEKEVLFYMRVRIGVMCGAKVRNSRILLQLERCNIRNALLQSHGVLHLRFFTGQKF